MTSFFVVNKVGTVYDAAVQLCDFSNRVLQRSVKVGGGAAMFLAAAAVIAAEVVQLPKVTVRATAPLVKVGEFRMAERRFAAAAVAYGPFIYIIAGSRDRTALLDSIERFDPRTGRSEVVAHLSTARMWHRAVVLGDRIYVLGGTAPFGGPATPRDDSDPSRDVLALTSVEVFEPATGEMWKADSLPRPVSGFGCVAIDSKICVIGGVLYQFAASNGEPAPAAPGARTALDAATFGPGVTGAVMTYDPPRHTWELGPPLPKPREAVAITLGNGSILVPGGYDGQELACVDLLDFGSKTWRSMPELCHSTNAAAAIALGRYVFLFGDEHAPKEVVAFDVKTGESDTFTLPHAVPHTAAAVLLDRKIYLIGGRDVMSDAASDRIEVFALRNDPGAKP